MILVHRLTLLIDDLEHRAVIQVHGIGSRPSYQLLGRWVDQLDDTFLIHRDDAVGDGVDHDV